MTQADRTSQDDGTDNAPTQRPTILLARLFRSLQSDGDFLDPDSCMERLLDNYLWAATYDAMRELEA